jgi:hypothetical protein
MARTTNDFEVCLKEWENVTSFERLTFLMRDVLERKIPTLKECLEKIYVPWGTDFLMRREISRCLDLNFLVVHVFMSEKFPKDRRGCPAHSEFCVHSLVTGFVSKKQLNVLLYALVNEGLVVEIDFKIILDGFTLKSSESYAMDVDTENLIISTMTYPSSTYSLKKAQRLTLDRYQENCKKINWADYSYIRISSKNKEKNVLDDLLKILEKVATLNEFTSKLTVVP